MVWIFSYPHARNNQECVLVTQQPRMYVIYKAIEQKFQFVLIMTVTSGEGAIHTGKLCTKSGVWPKGHTDRTDATVFVIMDLPASK